MVLTLLDRILGLVAYMLVLLPSRGENDLAFRYESADAILFVTNDPAEQLTLAKLQRQESGFRRNIARCERTGGDSGKSKGAFQVQPMGAQDAKDVCGTMRDQAALALRYLHRSAEICSSNHGVSRFNLYMSGNCALGTKAAEKRIVLDPETDPEATSFLKFQESPLP